jgi:formate hydrogenlyase subunit 6/NADH:ubiquinone oxidoreductase subunit I
MGAEITESQGTTAVKDSGGATVAVAVADAPVMEFAEAVALGLAKFGVVLGWAPGRDGNLAPAFARSAEQASALAFGPSAVFNPARYVRDHTPCAVVAKPCDTRSLVQMMSENMLDRDEVFVIGLRCPGVADMKKVVERYGWGARVEQVGPDWLVNGDKADKADLLDARCRACLRREPVIADVVVGEPVTPPAEAERFTGLPESMAERGAFWEAEFGKCIRCYACRNACPLCYCQDVCVAQARQPHWLTDEATPAENWMWQMIRMAHLAGRCTQCGECNRACPVDIRLDLLTQELGDTARELFDYEAGLDPGQKAPFVTYDKERDEWPIR